MQKQDYVLTFVGTLDPVLYPFYFLYLWAPNIPAFIVLIIHNFLAMALERKFAEETSAEHFSPTFFPLQSGISYSTDSNGQPEKTYFHNWGQVNQMKNAEFTGLLFQISNFEFI